MEHVYILLLILSMLQLCRAEISQVLPGTWFSANAINDEFSPKPISELFSTETSSTQTPLSFSVTQPIVVLPHSSTPNQISTLSSLLPSTKSPFSSSTYSTSGFTDISSTATPLSSTFGNTDLSSISVTPSTVPTPTFVVDTTLSQEPKDETPTIIIGSPQTSSTRLPTFSTELPSTPSTIPQNYFLIYQQAPQSIQNMPQRLPEAVTNQLQSTVSTVPTPLLSTIFSTTAPPTSVTPSTSLFTASVNPCNITVSPISSTIPPTRTTTLPAKVPGPPNAPTLLIRVIAPKGSITNVKINPTTSTTPKPRTTRRTKKPKRNTYELCLQPCRGKKDPICANPLSAPIIDPKALKDFPSICHMACHNSYKNQPYEKLVDGRCSRLRTRILSVGTNQKLRREELKKSEYSIVNTGPGTVVEFSNTSI